MSEAGSLHFKGLHAFTSTHSLTGESSPLFFCGLRLYLHFQRREPRLLRVQRPLMRPGSIGSILAHVG